MLEETINNLINTKRKRILQKMQKRIEEMSPEWWSQKWAKTFEMMYYYQDKPDHEVRHKVAVLQMERLSDIYEGYKKIVQNAENDLSFDIDNALQTLKNKVALYDEELAKWRKQLGHYEGSEKYLMRE